MSIHSQYIRGKGEEAVLPPTHSGIMAITKGFQSNAILEESLVNTTPRAINNISESVTVTVE